MLEQQLVNSSLTGTQILVALAVIMFLEAALFTVITIIFTKRQP